MEKECRKVKIRTLKQDFQACKKSKKPTSEPTKLAHNLGNFQESNQRKANAKSDVTSEIREQVDQLKTQNEL